MNFKTNRTQHSMQTYFENGYNTISFSEPDEILISSWRNHPPTDLYREGMEALISAIKLFGTGKVIFDLTELESKEIFPSYDRDWLAFHWYDKAIEAGYACVALVMPVNFFSQKAVVDHTSMIKTKIPTIHLDDMSEALEWIRQFKFEKEKSPLFWVNTRLENTSKYVEAYNRQLEELIAERTMDIERLNEKLVQYSFFNSHRIRGPLARILGIINVIKCTSNCRSSYDNCQNRQLIDALQKTGEELDAVVKEITAMLYEESKHWEEKYGKLPYAVKRKLHKI